MFRPATRSLVHTDGIESCAIGFRCDAAHIVRLAAAFEAVQEYDGRRGRPVWLPVAEAEYLGVRLGSEEP